VRDDSKDPACRYRISGDRDAPNELTDPQAAVVCVSRSSVVLLAVTFGLSGLHRATCS